MLKSLQQIKTLTENKYSFKGLLQRAVGWCKTVKAMGDEYISRVVLRRHPKEVLVGSAVSARYSGEVIDL